MTASGYGIPFWDGEHILELGSDGGCTTLSIPKSY